MQTTSNIAKPPVNKKNQPANWKMYVAAGALLVIVGASAWGIRSMTAEPDVPPVNSSTATLVKFLSTEDYAELPFDRKQVYMRVLEDREDNDELKAAFKSGQITDGEYRAAQMEAWLGQQLKRSDKFAQLPPGAKRLEYVRELLDRKAEKDAEKAQKDASKPQDETPAGGPLKVKRDQSMEDIRIAEFPADIRQRYEDYRRAYKEEKDRLEAAAAAAASPASSASATATPAAVIESGK